MQRRRGRARHLQGSRAASRSAKRRRRYNQRLARYGRRGAPYVGVADLTATPEADLIKPRPATAHALCGSSRLGIMSAARPAKFKVCATVRFNASHRLTFARRLSRALRQNRVPALRPSWVLRPRSPHRAVQRSCGLAGDVLWSWRPASGARTHKRADRNPSPPALWDRPSPFERSLLAFSSPPIVLAAPKAHHPSLVADG